MFFIFPFEDPGVTINKNGLPGISTLQQIVGSVLYALLILCVLSIGIAGIIWGWGAHSENPNLASRGKTGVVISIIASIIIGSANFFVSWGSGTKIKSAPSYSVTIEQDDSFHKFNL